MPGIVGSVVAAALDLLAAAFGWNDVRIITKPLPALILAAVAWRAGGRGGRILAAGLLFAAAGDEVLLHSGDAAFMAGMGAFAAMQFAYILAYLRAGAGFRPSLHTAAIALGYAAFAVVLFAWLLPKAGGLAIPLVAYAALLLCMASLALHMPRATAFGGALFICSDMLLAVAKFQGAIVDPNTTECMVLATYFAAQILIVAGMAARSTEA